MTGSLVISFFLTCYRAVNGWYENSFCYRAVSALSGFVSGSFCFRLIGERSPRKYAAGSRLFRLIYAVLDFFWLVARKAYALLDALAAGSFLKRAVSASVVMQIKLEWAVAAGFFVAVIVPSQNWNNLYILLMAVAFAGLLLWKRLRDKAFTFSLKEVSPALMLYIVIAVISLFTSYRLGDSLRVLTISLSCILFGMVTQGVIRTKRALIQFAAILLAGVFVSALYGLYQYHIGLEVRADLVDLQFSAGLRRLFSTVDNPNNYAEILVLTLPFAAALVLTAKNDWTRVVYLGLSAPLLLALLLTGSRAAYLVFVAAAGVFVLLVNKRLIPFFILLFLASVPFWPGFVVERVMTIGKDTSSSFRILIWQGAVNMLKHNWFAGIGMGPVTFANTFRNYVDYKAATAMHCHNIFLQVWAETGVAGVVTFVVYIANNAKSAVSLSLATKDNDLNMFLAAFAAAAAGILAFGMVEYVWFYPRCMLLFWIVMGMGAATFRLASEGLPEPALTNRKGAS